MKPDRFEMADGTEATAFVRAISWNLSGLRFEDFDTLLEQISAVYDWDVLLFQESFRSLDFQVGSHLVFTPSTCPSNVGCPVFVFHRAWSGRVHQLPGGGQWVAVGLHKN